MRIYGSKQIRDLVPLSSEHIRRLELAGKFPKHFKMVEGTGRNGAVGWNADEIDEWIEQRIASREAEPTEAA